MHSEAVLNPKGGSLADHLEHEIDARGTVQLILSLDLLPFVDPASRRRMDEIRGRAIFDDYLESLKVGPRFERDVHYTELEKQGYELGVFNQILVKDNFAPTYRLRNDLIQFPEFLSKNVQFRDKFMPVWNKWEFRLRLTRNGIITVIMKLDVPKRKRLILLSRDVMGLQIAFDMIEARRILVELEKNSSNADSESNTKRDLLREFIKWVDDHSLLETEQDYIPVIGPLAVFVIRQFIASVGGYLKYENPNGFDIKLTNKIEMAVGSPLREEYTIFQLDEITQFDRETRKNKVIAPRKILEQPEYAQLISALLEGIVIERRSTEKNQSKSYFYPEHSATNIDHVLDCDCSSWADEFCIINQRSAAIYSSFPMEKEQVVFPSRTICYQDYWRCINRGLEFLLETKVLAQVAERTTYEKLDDALQLLRNNHQTPKSQELLALSNDAGNMARLMSHLRTITVPQITSRASYAVEKFEFFNQQTGIEKILAHAETNLRDLTDLMKRYNDLSLQIESQRTNEVALAITIVASLSLSLGVLNFPPSLKTGKMRMDK